MSKQLDSLIDEWARDEVVRMHVSGFPGINAVEKILRDPGFGTEGARDRILWWPKNRRLARVSKAMHQVDKLSQLVLIVDTGLISNDDGGTFTKYDLARYSSIDVRRFNEYRKKARIKLSRILWV